MTIRTGSPFEPPHRTLGDHAQRHADRSITWGTRLLIAGGALGIAGSLYNRALEDVEKAVEEGRDDG